MTLGDLNVGDIVYDPQTYERTSQQGGSIGNVRANVARRWQVIGKNHDGNNTVTLQSSSINASTVWDYREATNPISNRQTNGNSRYAYSNILQWLNSDASSNWFAKKHTYDAVSAGANSSYGNLYSFSNALKNKLVSVNKKSLIPHVDGGGTETVNAKVHLISVSEFFGNIVDYPDEGSQYEYYAEQTAKTYTSVSVYGTRTPRYNATEQETDDSFVVYYPYYYKSSSVTIKTDAKKADGINVSDCLIVLPSTTQVSSDKYKWTANNNEHYGTYYAMVNMPTVIELSNAYLTYEDAPTLDINYTLYDENYAISTFKIGLDSTDNIIYSTANLTKKKEYKYTADTTSWGIGDSHTYYFIATNSNGDTATETKQVTKLNRVPYIHAIVDGEERTSISLGDVTNPFTVTLKMSDPDPIDESIYLFISDNTYVGNATFTNKIGEYSRSADVEYTISDDIWKNIADGSHAVFFIVSNVDILETYTANRNYITCNFNKSTPAPYVTVDSTDIGRKNTGFTVAYTPDTDTIQDLTEARIYLDTDTLLQTVTNPIAGAGLTYAISKEDLYNMSIGNHTLTITVEDDLGQTGSANVSFTRFNDAPNVITASSLGDKNLAFMGEFGIEDSEEDTMKVNVYIDSTSSDPILSRENVSSGTTLNYSVTKDMLYGLSIGDHKVIIVAEDDIASTTANVAFTRINYAPYITADENIGNKNAGFSENFTVRDSEGDTFSVKVYVDSTSSDPILSEDGITSETTLTYKLTKKQVYALSLGGHSIIIVTEDEFGKRTHTTAFTRFNDSPLVTMSQDVEAHMTDFDVTYKVTDTEDDDVTVTFTVGDTVIAVVNNVERNTELTQMISLDDIPLGQNTLTATAVDTVGQTSTATLDFFYGTVPEIMADDLGNKSEPFTGYFQIHNDSGDEVDVKVFLDNNDKLVDIDNAALDTDIGITISKTMFDSLDYGVHTLSIGATSENGYSATKDITFGKYSVPTLTMDKSTVPETVDKPFKVSFDYYNDDDTELTVRLFIDDKEISL